MRYYKVKDSQYPSVTTILSATRPKADVESLQRWRDRVGHDVANQKLLAAGKRGTRMHELCESYVLGNTSETQDSKIEDYVHPYWESIKPELSNITNVYATEQRVHHDKLMYAGALDSLATYKGVENTLIDFKSADKKKDSKYLTDYKIQLAAYSGAAHQIFGLTINQAVLIFGIPNRKAQVEVVSRDMLLIYWSLWVDRVTRFYELYPANVDNPLAVIREP